MFGRPAIIVSAEEKPKDRKQLESRFDELLAQSRKQEKLGKLSLTRIRGVKVRGEPTEVDVAVIDTPANSTTPTTSVPSVDGSGLGKYDLIFRLWAVPSDGPMKGRAVNLAEYEWRPDEPFVLYIESSVPVQFSLGQVYPDQSNRYRLVLPRDGYPLDLTTVMPGREVRFPIPFRMDNDSNDEYMSICVVRADGPDRPIVHTQQNTHPDTISDDNEGVLRGAVTKLKELHKQALAGDAASRERFRCDSSRSSAHVSGTSSEVATLIAGTNGKAEYTIRLRKIRN
jgi:hypothetical protein